MSNILLTHSPYRHHALNRPVRRRSLFHSSAPSAARFKFEFGPWSLIVLLFIIGVVISSIYLMHFNTVATRGYDIRKLQADRQQLLTEYGVKDTDLAAMKSLNAILNSPSLQSMRKPSQIVFVQADTVLASR